MVIAALALYWPTLFVLAHIPIPQVVRQAHMYDKSLHLLAYMILTFLLWSAVKPREKVHWRRATVWCLLAIVAAYGVCDECLQHFVADRSMDPRDLLADAIGAAAALGLLTILPFWPTSVIIAGTTILTLAVFTRANLTALLPVTGTVFHLLTYAVFTLLWIGYLRQRPHPLRMGLRWVAASMSLPLVLVAITKVSTMISSKAFEGEDIVAATAGILASIAGIGIASLLAQRNAGGTILCPTEE
ncbi:MAG: VanZ family protein [Sedimentisphaerales bacterium]|nr:VanZ family protein [Sedimentisphaerales bacterium]